jgi:hypothetical protein
MTETEHGPFQTEREASQTKAVRAVYAAFDADPGAGKMRPHNTAMLTAACEAAGVELGAYDRQVLAWLGNWEPATCAVIAGLIIRRRAKPHSFTRDELADALTRLEIRVRLDGPAARKVNAGSMADAIIKALEEAGR